MSVWRIHVKYFSMGKFTAKPSIYIDNVYYINVIETLLMCVSVCMCACMYRYVRVKPLNISYNLNLTI